MAQTITEVYLPKFVQGAGTYNTADDKKLPYVCRLTITGLTAGTTYRYYSRFVSDPSSTSNGEGTFIYVKQSGDFVRKTSPSLLTSGGKYGELTADANGAYTGWFMTEVSESGTFTPGNQVYFRVILNNGTTSGSVYARLTVTTPVNVINFDATAAGGTGIRSTPATSGMARNFVLFWDNEAETGQPIAGTVIESDGIENTLANGYADFYDAQVNTIDKTWGTIIPNNLTSGIRRIAQYSLVDGTEVGFKTSTDGTWAQQGGGTVSTVNTTGGITSVIALEGSQVTLGMPLQQSQTITFTALTPVTYGESDFSLTGTASSGLAVTYSSSDPTVATVTGNTVHIVGAGTTDITANQSGSEDFFSADPVVQTLTVNKAGLTITADNQVKVQGDPLPAFTFSYAGFVNGEDATILTDQPDASTTADANSPAGDYPITISGAAALNYAITYVAGTLHVYSGKQSQTISFNAIADKVYGAADFSPGATTTSGLPISYSSSDASVAIVENNKLKLVGTGITTITASQPGNANYDPASDATQSLTVTKGALTIKADNQIRFFNQPNPALTVTYTGLAYDDTGADLISPPVVSTTATQSSEPGDYPITVSGATSNNYTISYEEGVLTVQPQLTQSITFGALNAKKYGDTSFDPGATASSGLTISYQSSNSNVAVIENGQVKLTGAGSTIITASQPGNISYSPATGVTQSLVVNKANLIIQALDTVKFQADPNPEFTAAYSGFVYGEDLSSLDEVPSIVSDATINSVAGKYDINITGGKSNKYNIARLTGTLTVLPPQGDNQDYLTAYVSSPGNLKVNVHVFNDSKTTIQLFDMTGSKLLQTEAYLAKGFNELNLNISNLLTGNYFLRAGSSEFMLKTKLFLR
jgi:hypothetical protein